MIDGWLEGKVQLGAIAIGGEVEMDANDAQPNPQDPRKNDAIEWLRSKCNKMHLIRQALCALCRERESTKSCRGRKSKSGCSNTFKAIQQGEQSGWGGWQ